MIFPLIVTAFVLVVILGLALWVLLGGKPARQMEDRDTDVWKHSQPPHVNERRFLP